MAVRWQAHWTGLIHLAINCLVAQCQARFELVNDDKPLPGHMTSRRRRCLIPFRDLIILMDSSLALFSAFTSRLPSDSTVLFHLFINLSLSLLTLQVSRQ